MRKITIATSIFLALICLPLSSCASAEVFTITQDGRIISPDGTEYVFIDHEGSITHFGETAFAGKIKGEKSSFEHLSMTIQTGMFSLGNDTDRNILVRNVPDNEFKAYYRKASLPELVLSPENCIRLEYISASADNLSDIQHMNCGKGITDKNKIQLMISEIEQGQTAQEAGLYDAIRKPDGSLENCYKVGAVYGYFQDEKNIAMLFTITSFDDKAFSISINDKELVLPEKWLTELQNASNE